MCLYITSTREFLLTGNAFIVFESFMSYFMSLQVISHRECVLTGHASIVIVSCMH